MEKKYFTLYVQLGLVGLERLYLMAWDWRPVIIVCWKKNYKKEFLGIRYLHYKVILVINVSNFVVPMAKIKKFPRKIFFENIIRNRGVF